jgi:hypothetical protein
MSVGGAKEMSVSSLGLLFAGFGGLLPTLANIAASFAAKPEQPLPHWHIVIPLLAFAFIGAVLSYAFNREHDIKKAIMIGICAPGIITNIIAGATSNIGRGNQARLYLPSITASAFAQDSPSMVDEKRKLDVGKLVQNSPEETEQKIKVTAVGNSLRFSSNVYGIWPKDADVSIFAIGGSKDILLTSIPVGAATTLQFPPDTKSLSFKIGTETYNWNLPKGIEGRPDDNTGFTASATVTTKPTISGDILWALGGHRSATVVDLNVAVKPLTSGIGPPSPQVRRLPQAETRITP